MPAVFALPELLAVVVGLLALIIYLGFGLLRALFDLASSKWLVVGRIIDHTIGAALDWAWHQLESWLHSAISGIVNLFHAPATNVDSFAKASVAAHVHHQQYADWISGVHLITMENDTRALIRNDIAALRSEIDGTLVPSIDRALWNLGVAINQIQGAELPALDAVVGTVQTQLAEAYRILAAQQQQIGAVAVQLDRLPGYVDTQVARGVDAAEGQARGYTDALGQEVVSGLHAGAPALPVDLTGALSATAAAAVAASTFVKECGEPMCDWWHTNSNPLAQLLALVSVVEVAQLLTEAVNDPRGVASAAAAVEDEFRSLGNDVLGLFGLAGVG